MNKTPNRRRWPRSILLAAAFLLLATCGMGFIVTHPKCEVCGRRFGPLIAHNYRHQTTKAANNRKTQAIARARATAPVINSLPPVTAANKDLQLTNELLVGRWESQDGANAPLRFHENGVVEYGSTKSETGWNLVKGTFAIVDGKVETKPDKGGLQLWRVFKFARGVLYAPRGPSPQVVWERVSDP